MDISIGTIIFSILGLILLINGLSQLTYNLRLKKNGTRTVAEIMDFEINSDYDLEHGPRISKYPYVKFKNIKGTEIIKKLTQGDSSYMIGQRVYIIYKKNKADYDITIDSKIFLIRFPLGMAIVGLIILLIITILTLRI